MAQKFHPIRYLDFSGGQNDKVVNHLMLDSEVRLAENCVLDEIGSLKKRQGYSQIGAQITAGTVILGNYYFVDKDETHSQHIVVCADDADTLVDAYYNDSGTWTKITGVTDWTNGKKVRFESFLDRVFFTNGYNAPKSWSGSGSADTTDLSNAPTCKYIRVYQDRIYLANEPASNPSRVYFSSVPSSGTVTWDTIDDWLDVNPEDGDTITGLAENSGRLLIFKNNAMFRWNGKSTDADPIIDIGTSSQESVKTMNGITYFFNRYGVYAYDGGMPYLISRKIQKWIDGIDQTALEDVNAEVDGDHYCLAVGNVTVDGTNYKNVVLVYNIHLKGWTVWTLKNRARALEHYYSSGARLISFGDDNGEVFKLNDGNSDNGEAIPVNIKTKYYDLQTAEEEKQFSEVYVITEKGRGIVEVGCELDNYPYKSIGYTDNDVTRLPSNLKGKKISVVLSESGTGEQWSFQQLIFRDTILLGSTY